MSRRRVELPRLATDGPRIICAETGQTVRLRGVNVSGLEYVDAGAGRFHDAAGITQNTLTEIVDGWGANVVRVPFNQARVLHAARVELDNRYLEDLDDIVRWASGLGAYVLLALQWRDTSTVFGYTADGRPNRVPPLPDAGALEVWRVLARRYRDHPAVLYDIFSEPHDPIRVRGRTDHAPLVGVDEHGRTFELGSRRVTMPVWQAWARALIATILQEHPSALIFVSGIGWAYDLRGMPLERGSRGPLATNLVYSTHVYPWCRLSWRRWRRSGRSLYREWDRAFGHLAGRVPVFAAEWGGLDSHTGWGEELAAYLDDRELGWTAWSWRDWPPLVENGTTARPTPFGEVVRRATRPLGLRGPARVRH